MFGVGVGGGAVALIFGGEGDGKTFAKPAAFFGCVAPIQLEGLLLSSFQAPGRKGFALVNFGSRLSGL